MIVDRVTEYAKHVVAGLIVAGESARQSCQRHLNDLDRQNTPDFPYRWDVERANELIDFAEALTLAEGMDETPLVLFDFQAFIFGSLNGWINMKGYRRFRTSYVQLARQQGKSLFNGVNSLYYSSFSGYQYPQVYTVATKAMQAMIVVKECIKFINADPDLQELFVIKEYKGKIECNVSNGYIQALGADTKSIDGFRPYYASVDEYHSHKTDQMYKLLQTGTKRMDESLISVITTAGFNLNSPCYELYKYCKNVVAGAVKDETQFVYIAELDKDDDPFNPKIWPKASPLWDETTAESMETFAVKARSMGGSEEMEFLTKALNQWVDYSDDTYVSASDFAQLASDLTLEDFRGHKVFFGLDLSSGGDLTSLAIVIPCMEGKVRKYYIYSHSFIPSKRVDEHIVTDKAPYKIWIKNKLITVTETAQGIKTDYKYVLEHIKKLSEEYEFDVQAVCYDPHNASGFIVDLEELGYRSVLIKQTIKELNDATVDFQLECKAGNVAYHKDSQVLAWSVVNATTITNSYGEIKIDKSSRNARIDPVDAVIDAWTLAMRAEVVSLSQGADEFLEAFGW